MYIIYNYILYCKLIEPNLLKFIVDSYRSKMVLCYNKGCGKEYSENGEGIYIYNVKVFKNIILILRNN